MNIDVKILIIRPTFINASEPLPIFVPSVQPVHEQPNLVAHAAPPRKLTLASFCRALLGLAFWWVVITLCVRLI
jgi:hypothetical protein